MKNKLRMFIFLSTLIFIPIKTLAWNGYDYENNSDVEIESGNLVRVGKDIEIYDYEQNDYHDAEVQSITNYGYTTEVEAYDYDAGEYRYLDMDQH